MPLKPQALCRKWSRSPERKRSKVWRRAASPDSSSSSSDGDGRRFLEQEDRRRAGRAGRFGTGAAADARLSRVCAGCALLSALPSEYPATFLINFQQESF